MGVPSVFETGASHDSVVPDDDAVVTVSVVVPETLPIDALTVADPAVIAVAKPEVLIVVTPVLDELHVTCVVTFCVVPSE